MKHLTEKIWGFWSKLGENKPGYHRRGCIYLGSNLFISLELSIGQYVINGASIQYGGDDHYRLMFHAGIYKFSFWLGFGGKSLNWIGRSEWWGGREIGFSIHDWRIFISLFYDEGISKSSGLKWCVDIERLLFGKTVHRKNEVIAEHDTVLSMPEGDYAVRSSISDYITTWKRIRKPRIVRRVDIESEKGIPAHAGKGENDWDMDDEKIFSFGCVSENVDDGLKQMRKSILQDRIKYGMPKVEWSF